MKKFWIVLLLLMSTGAAWAQAEGSKVVLDLSFELKGQLGEKSLETRPKVRTLSGQECEIRIGSGPEEPVENVSLKVTPLLTTHGRVELHSVFSLQVGPRDFQRRVRLVTLLGVPAKVSFEEEDLQIELTVVPTVWVD